MERKTKVHAEEGTQNIIVTREFDLPVELLFKAYEDPKIIEQWMGTKMLKLENRNHGSYQFETSDARGNVLVRGNGVIHEFVPNKKITRTFKMENVPFDVQLEFIEFEQLTEDISRVNMQIVFRSIELRDAQLKMPFAQGLNWAHNRIQEVLNKLK